MRSLRKLLQSEAHGQEKPPSEGEGASIDLTRIAISPPIFNPGCLLISAGSEVCERVQQVGGDIAKLSTHVQAFYAASTEVPSIL